jgi:hypothetical protein
MEDTKKIYLSSMIPSELLDDDDDLTPSEDVGNHLVQYEFIDLVENIGKEEFKETYMNFIEDIRSQSFDNQKILCYYIINKVQEVYDFEFPEKINISDISDIEEIYSFIEFLEYDNIYFLVSILHIFDINFLKTDPYDFCQKNKNEIIKQINNINLSSIFLNLYNTLENNILINIISNMITKNKGLITNELKIRELNITSEKIGE